MHPMPSLPRAAGKQLRKRKWTPRAASNVLQSARPLLGTLVSIRIESPGIDCERAMRSAFAAVEAVHWAMSFHERGSELDRLNRDAWHTPQPVGRDTWRVLRASLALARASGGRFDPSIAGRLVRDGFLPADDGLRWEPDADWRDIVLGPGRTVCFRKRLLLDFGGIAKGHAVDAAVRALRAAGVRSATVNAGGDLRVFGDREQVFRVREPGDPTRSRPLLRLREGAVATSAGYFSERDGRTPLLDPHRDRSLGQGVSVSVCAPRAIWADALTKLVLIDDTVTAPLLHRLGASAVILHADGRCRRLGA